MTRSIFKFYFVVLLGIFASVKTYAQSTNFLWAQQNGASVQGQLLDVCVSNFSNSVYAGGETSNSSSTIYALPAVSIANGNDALLLKYTETGVLNWAVIFGGTGNEEIISIKEKANSRIIVGGNFSNSMTITGTTAASVSLISNGGTDMFFAEFDSSGGLIWAKNAGGINDDILKDIELSGNTSYFAGISESPVFGMDLMTLVTNGGQDAVGGRFNPTGNAQWLSGGGSSSSDVFEAVTVIADSVYFGGFFSGNNFVATNGVTSDVNASLGSNEGLLVKCNASNGQCLNTTTIKGNGDEGVYGLDTDGSDLFLTGKANGAISTSGSVSASLTSTEAIFAKYDSDLIGQWLSHTAHTAAGYSVGVEIEHLNNGHVVAVGEFTGAMGVSGFNEASSGNEDGFIINLNKNTGNALSFQKVGGAGMDILHAVAANSISHIAVSGGFVGNATVGSIGISGSVNLQPLVAYGALATDSVSLTGDAIICQGSSTDLVFTFSGSGPFDVSYSDGTNTVNLTGLASSPYMHSVSPSATTTYTILSFSSSAGGGSFSSNATVTVNSGISNNIIYSDTSHCGPSGSNFTGTIPTGGGSGGVNYQWQYYSNSGNWTNAQGVPNNAQNYVSTLDNVTRLYRRRVFVSGCPTSNSNVLTATIVDPIGNNIVSGDQSSCGTSFDPVSFTTSSPSGGTGSYNYLWQMDNNPAFSSPSVAGTNQAYNPPAQSQTLYFRRIVTSSVCMDTSTTITVTLDPDITGNTISTSQTICGPGTPAQLIGSSLGGGTGVYASTWQSSPDNSTWSDVASTPNYQPGSLSSTTYYRRMINSGTCSDISNVVTITVDALIAGNTITHAGVDSVCSGSAPNTFIGTAPTGGDNSTYTFLWQVSSDNSTWSTASGTSNTNDYFPPSQTAVQYYRRQVSSGACPASFSNVIQIDVYPPISNNDIFTDQTICANTSPSLLTGTAAIGGNGGAPVYEWYVSTDDITYNPIPSSNSINFQPSVLSVTTYYRRNVAIGPCSVHQSDKVVITVEPAIANNSIAADQLFCGTAITTATLDGSTSTGGTGSMLYEWYESTDSLTWTFTNVTSEDFNPGTVSTTTYFYRIVKSGACTIADTSNVVTIQIDDLISNNSISLVGNDTICEGTAPGNLNGSTPIGGTGTYTYLWEVSLDNSNWTAAPGTNNGLGYVPPTQDSVRYYRRTIVSGSCPNSISNVIKIDVYPPISNNFISADQTICANTLPSFLTGTTPVGGSSPTSLINWQYSNDNIVFTPIPFTNSINYQPADTLTVTTYFRRRVERGLCGMNWSDTVTITVEPEIANNNISSDQFLCGTTTANTLDGDPAIGGNGTMIYQWFESTDSLSWTATAITEDYNPGTVSDTTFYFRTVISGACLDADTSNVVTINVGALISNNVIGTNTTICNGSQPDTLTGSIATGGTGVIVYAWEESTDGLTWVAANGTLFGFNFLPPTLSVDTWYRRIANSGSCPGDTSNFVLIEVDELVANNIVTTPVTLCSNDNTGILDGSIPTGGTGIYTYEWGKSFDNITWSPVGSSNTEDLTLGGVSTSTYFRRIVSSGACAADTSASVYQVVSPFITTNTIGSSEIICYDSIPNALSGAVQIPGSFGFSWQQSTDSVTFQIASGTYDNASYQPGNLDSTTFYYRIIKSGACPNDTSNIVKIEVLDTISNNIISVDSTVCFGASGIDLPGSVPMGGDGNYTYLWESSVDNGITYTTAAGLGASNAQGFTTGVLTQTTYFRRTVFNTPCSKDSILSNVIIVTVQAALANNSISMDQILCGNYTAAPITGLPVTGGSGIPSYQWQSSNNASTWLNVIGQTGQDVNPGTITDTLYYRRLATSGACSIADTSNVVTLTYLNTIALNVIFNNDTICSGTSPATILGFVGGGGDNSYTYTWEESSDSLNWSSAIGTSGVVSFDPVPLTDTTYFRLITSSSVCPHDTSNTVVIFVEDSIGNNIISGPTDICSNSTTDSILGTTPSGGNGIYIYQWEIYDSLVMNWVNAPGVSSNQDYAIAQFSDSANYRRIVFSGQCGSDTSTVILIAVQPYIDMNTIFNDQSICMNTAPLLLTGQAPTGNGFIYFWELSTDNNIFSTPSAGVNLSTYQPGILDSTTYFRRIIFSGVCGYDTSNVVTISVWDSLTNNIINQDTTVCFNSGPITLTGSSILGGSGNYAYLWEESIDGIVFGAPAINFTSPDYTTGVLTQDTYFRRMVTDIDCTDDTLYGNIIMITVHPEITHNFNITADTVCEGGDVNVLFQISGNAPYEISYTNNGVFDHPTGISAAGYDLTFTPSSSGYIILDTVWDANGCFIEPADSFSFRVVAYPVVDLGLDTTVCDSYEFNPINGTGVLDFTSPTLGALSATFPQEFTPSTFGTHQFFLTENVENCLSTDSIIVTFEESIGYISAGDDQSIIIQDSTALFATELLPNQNGYWTLISGGGNFADSSDPKSTFLNLISGVTVLEWTVEQDVCPAEYDQVTIVVQNLLVPTGFSPNNDGDNDFLEVAGREDINTIDVQVFDRWGGLVFEDKNYQNDWYGTSKSGEPLPEDTYFVIIDLGDKGVHKSYLIIRR